MNLQNWFSKGNSRRFHRVNMQVQCFITPKEPIYQRQIFALGIDYYPESQKIAIAKQRKQVEDLIPMLPKENRQIVNQVFYGVMHHFDLFLEAIINASEGKDPRQHSIHWHTLVQSCNGIKEIDILEKHSPKTYQYLKQVDYKFSPFVSRLVESINASNVNHFSAPQPLPSETFKLDELTKELENEKYQNIPLAQSIVHLNYLLSLYIGIFENFYNDHFLKDYPKLWPLREANISIGGIALKTDKSYELFSRVNVHLYFETDNVVLKFDGSVVKIEKLPDGENIAINFELPEASQQEELQQLIYQSEVEETFGIKLPY